MTAFKWPWETRHELTIPQGFEQYAPSIHDANYDPLAFTSTELAYMKLPFVPQSGESCYEMTARLCETSDQDAIRRHVAYIRFINRFTIVDYVPKDIISAKNTIKPLCISDQNAAFEIKLKNPYQAIPHPWAPTHEMEYLGDLLDDGGILQNGDVIPISYRLMTCHRIRGNPATEALHAEYREIVTQIPETLRHANYTVYYHTAIPHTSEVPNPEKGYFWAHTTIWYHQQLSLGTHQRRRVTVDDDD